MSIELIPMDGIDMSRTGMTLHTSSRLIREMAKSVGPVEYCVVTQTLFDQLAIAAMILPGTIPLHLMYVSTGAIVDSKILVTVDATPQNIDGDIKTRNDIYTDYTSVDIYSSGSKELVRRIVGIRIK